MKIKLCLFLVVIFLICGCTRITEVDSKSFVTAIGFDKGENYELRFTFVFTSPSKSSSSKGAKGDETIVIEAPSLYSAIEQINNFKSQSIVLTHTQTLIFSEELAKEGLGEYIYMLVRSNHFRPNTYVCITDKSSMEFLEKINPVQTYHLEKYFQLLFNKMTSGTKGDLYLYDSYFRLLGAGRASVLPYCAINETKLKTANESEESPSEGATEEPSEGETLPGKFADNTDDYAINITAGHTISKSDNSSEVQGVAVIKDGKLVTVLGRGEAIAMQMITNSLPPSYVTLSNPYHPEKMITCYIASAKNTSVKVRCEETPKISISVNLEGDFTEVGSDDTFIENPRLFESYFEKKTEETLTKFLDKTIKLGCDICAFSEAAKLCFLTTDDWEAYSWEKRFNTSDFEVKVNLTVRTYGELSQKDIRSW